MKPRWQKWLVWLLPFLAARALVPAGFMVSVVDGGLSLTFCPSVEAPLSRSDAQQDASAQHADHHAHHGHTPTQQHSDHYRASDASMCAFGMLGHGCAPPSAHFTTVVVEISSEPLPSYSTPPESYRPLHADRIRGPPVSSLT